MEIIYAPNFDYEFELAGLAHTKIRSQIGIRFEWLIFWGESEHTFSSRTKFDSDFISYVNSLKSTVRQEQKSATHNWWGELKNLETERILNSKLFAAELAHDLLGFPFAKVKERSRLLATEVLYKEEFSVAGRGFSFTPKETSLFCEPLYKRCADIGSRYDRTSKGWELRHRSLSVVDHKFSFRGAHLNREREFELDFSEHDRQQRIILNSLPQELGVFSIQIDSFFFENEKGEVKVKGLGEFNYRRTMIDIFYHLLDALALKRGKVIMRAISPLAKKDWKTLISLCDQSAVLLSPPGARDLVLLIKNESEENELLRAIASELAVQF